MAANITKTMALNLEDKRQLYAIVMVGLLLGVILVSDVFLNVREESNEQTVQEESFTGIHTPTSLWTARESLVGTSVTVEGIITFNRMACTRAACIPDDSFCNTCRGSAGFEAADNTINVRPLACRGNTAGDVRCYLQFANESALTSGSVMEDGKKYRATGVLQVEENNFYIQLGHFEPVP